MTRMTHDFFSYPDQFFNYEIKSKFVVCFWYGKKTIIFFYCNVDCIVSIIAMFALFLLLMSWMALGSFRLLLSLDCQQKKWVWNNPYYLLFYFFAVFLHIDLCLDYFNWLTGAI